MNNNAFSRRRFLKTTGLAAGTLISSNAIARYTLAAQTESATPDYVLHIENSVVEIAPKRFIPVTTYNGQFPGPLLRFKEGRPVTIEIFNDTDTPEQLHWHGQRVPTDVDGAAEEGTPFIPPRESVASLSLPSRPACASTTRTIAQAPTSRPGSTAARSDRCTSSPKKILGDSIGRSLSR